MKKIFTIICFAMLAMSLSGQADIARFQYDSGKTYAFELSDESKIVGEIIGKDSSFFIVKTLSINRLEVSFSQIKKISPVVDGEVRNGTYWFPNPNATRYLFAPSAIQLKKGEGYYQNTYLLLNSFNYGVTNHFSIGGGFEFLSTFTPVMYGQIRPIFFITPKLGTQVSKNAYLATGIMYVSMPESDYNSNKGRTGLGIPYCMGTFGNTNNNMSIGLGMPFAEKKFSDRPLLTVSGMTRVSKKTGLITENWIIPSSGSRPYEPLFSYGIRFIGEKLSVDLALLNSVDLSEEFLVGFPFVDFMVKF